MQILESIAALRAMRRSLSGSVGFVPTMGYLHEGHLTLVRQAAQENDLVVVSIFVNPTQFGPGEDFNRYPRDHGRDLQMLESVGTHFVFLPSVEEIYPPDFQTYVEVTQVSKGLEGARRPGHFRGVATVVGKLFNLVQPDRVYFGEKDAQQVAVIRQMVRDLAFPLDMVVVPTQRADDGLALSSRNVYLNEEQRKAAPVIYRALLAARQQYIEGVRDTNQLRGTVQRILAQEPLANVDYISVADAQTLEELSTHTDRPVLISLSVLIGKTHLIDNMTLSE